LLVVAAMVAVALMVSDDGVGGLGQPPASALS
jgi:hypothetical protein